MHSNFDSQELSRSWICTIFSEIHIPADNSAKLHKTVEIKVRKSMMASEKLLEPILKQTSLGTIWACWYKKACTLAGEFKDILIPGLQFKAFCLF